MLLALFFALLAGLNPLAARAAENISLAGEWRFALDRGDAGVREQWFGKDLSDRIALPGVLQSQGYGDEISTNTPWVLSLYDRFWYLREDYKPYTKPGNVKVPFVCQPPRHYLGAAWYQRDVEIPANWQGRRVVLNLERPHWESTVWVDDRKVGSNNSLCAPHVYDLGTLAPGKHRLSIRVDNRMILPYRPDAHSVSDSLGGSWNGIVGRIELTATSLVWIDDAQVFPNVAKKSALIKVQVGNMTGKAGRGTLSVGAPARRSPAERDEGGKSVAVAWDEKGGKAELEVPLGNDAQLWDEFHPVLQRLTVQLKGEQADDRRELTFGLREFKAEGQDFVINGRKTNLRGTHNGGDFPLTGSPPTDVESWRKIFRTCREWGLNHMRFHSFCPPEAAFVAADELGFYLQPECGMWNDISPGTAMERMMYEETDRMIKAYGNHPSFTLLSPSNEPKGRWKESLPKWVEHYRKEDPRRLYTTGTGWSLIDVPGPVEGRGLSGRPPHRPKHVARQQRVVRAGLREVATGRQRARGVTRIGPVVRLSGLRHHQEIHRLHATGQLRDFPRLAGRARAAGQRQGFCLGVGPVSTCVLQGGNRSQPADAGPRRVPIAGPARLRRAGHGVGRPARHVLGIEGLCRRRKSSAASAIRPCRWRGCGIRVFTTADPFDVDVEVAHFGAEPIANAVPVWQIVDANGTVVAKGEWPARTIPIGKNIALGKITADLSKLAAPRAYKLVVGLRGTPFENDWDFWLYPAQVDSSAPKDVLVTRSWDEAEARLFAGGKVLFLPRDTDLDWTSPPLDTVPVFWNRLMNPAWGRMLGLWCDAKHPALAGFPTEANCDWQWTEIVRRVRAVNLDRLPRRLQPIVQAIDDWNRNYKLGLVFECRVGTGRLMVCSVDLESALNSRPVARQLRRSLLDYMASRAVPAAGRRLGRRYAERAVRHADHAQARCCGQGGWPGRERH